ncbi:MAG: magnesium/cobalt transporter CorA [Flavobacteriaceae bacterium]|nr:magnesium/cobalt transporter CorA [Flavobacteriaceae bacterium]MCB0474681.1 magnesium/cobalt transporter CorA [Flavobacteriaceae bacterium]
MKRPKPKRKKTSVSKKVGLPPGSITYIGRERSEKVSFDLVCYNLDSYVKKQFDNSSDLFKQLDLKMNNWINVDGIHDQNSLNGLENSFGLDHLLLEDVANAQQRPKVEISDNSIFLTLRMLSYEQDSPSVDNEQVSLVLTDKYLITFQEKSGDVFGTIRDRIVNSKGQIRSKKGDYLFYSLIDSIIDNYFLVIENIGNNLEDLEDEVFENPSQEFLEKIHFNKNELLTLRRAIYPLRESILKLLREDNGLILPDTVKYFNDVYDHIIQIIDILESYKEITSSLKDSYLSSLSFKMNQVMQVLTIIATIFIPLTFLTGIYGMNFEKIPELHWSYGYLYFWIVSVAIVSVLIFYFKRKKWL